MHDGHLVLYRQTLVPMFYIISALYEDELLLSEGFSMLYDTLSLFFRKQIEKQVLLDNLNVLALALDETFDEGMRHIFARSS